MSENEHEPEVTQDQLNAATGAAVGETNAVVMHTEQPAPATQEGKLDRFHDLLTDVQSRVYAIEQVIGLAAPVAGSLAGLVPGGAAIATPVLEFLPAVENTVNSLIAELQQNFGGKVASNVASLPPAPAKAG